jgi:lycopene cyclase domain-containing protein
MLFTTSYALAQSFERRIRFVRFWPGVFLGTLAMWVLFVPWDMWFTASNAWGFNEKFITGIHLGNLPIEEWLFFIVVPFACAFIYEVLNYFIPDDILGPAKNKISATLILLGFVLSVVFVDRIYTFVTFSLLSLFLVWHLLIKRSAWLGRFYLAYLIIQIPFFLVNGALTGLFTKEPVVWYSNNAIMGPRLITIPLEDMAYNMLMLLIVISVLEQYKSRKLKPSLTSG